MNRMRRRQWRRVAEHVDGVLETREAVGQEVLGVKQTLWVGMRAEEGEDFGSLDGGCIEPLRY